MATTADVEALLESGAHFGHLTRRWNPKMRRFIFMERNGIHIIDLRKTQALLNIAREAANDLAAQGKNMLFVGTKTQAKGILSVEAQRSNMNYVTERWLGGMLTNFPTIRKSIKRLTTIDKMEADGTFEKITKKERMLLSRERDRLRLIFGGIENMTRMPGALFVVDVKKEHLAIKEARTLGIPVFGIVDTNCDPEVVDYPIPANDDSIKTIELITKVLTDALVEGREAANARNMDTASGEHVSKENDQTGDDGKARRQMRGRKPGGRQAEGASEGNEGFTQN
ncbi:MAG: 30S ribosomal protein S2 [Bacteroidota bacterium]